MGKEACSPKYVAAYFLMLEQLRQGGYLDNLSQASIEKIVKRSLEIFDKNRQNIEKYNRVTEAFGNSVAVNFISKYYLTALDFAEKTGVRSLFGENPDGKKFFVDTALDVDLEVTPIELPAEKDGVVPVSSSFVGGHLNYPEDQVLVYRDSKATPAAVFLSGEDRRLVETIQEGVKDTLLENRALISEIAKKVGPLIEKNRFPQEKDAQALTKSIGEHLTEDSFRREFINQTVSHLSSIVDEKYEKKIGAEGETPIRVNGNPIRGVYYEISEMKKLVGEMIEDAVAYSIGAGTLGISYIYNQEEKTAILSTIKEVVSGYFDEIGEEMVLAQKRVMDEKIFDVFQRQQSGGLREFSAQFQYTTFSKETEDLVDTEKEKKALVFSVDIVADKPALHTVPITSSKKTKYEKYSFSREVVNDDNIGKLDRVELQPENVTIYFDPKKKKSWLGVENFVDGENIPLSVINNEGMAHSTLVSKNFTESGELGIYAIDEADLGAGGKVLARVEGALGAAAKNNVIATGTPTEGTPASSAELLGLGGGQSIKAIQANKDQFTAQCGIFEIKSKLIARLVVSLGNSEILNIVEAAWSDYRSAKDKNAEVSDFVEKTLIPTLIDKGMLDASAQDDLELTREIFAVRRLFDKTTEQFKNVEGAIAFKDAVEQGLYGDYTLTKIYPGIQNPKTFAGLINSVPGNQSVMSRTTLTGKPETLTLSDLERLNNIFSTSENGIMRMNDIELFMEQNRVSARMLQASVGELARKSFLYDIRAILEENMRGFLGNFGGAGGKEPSASDKKALKPLVSHLNTVLDLSEELTIGGMFSMMQRQTSSSSDSFLDMYKAYLYNNKELPDLLARKSDAERLLVFNEMLRLFDVFLKKGIANLSEGKTFKLTSPYNPDLVIDLSNSGYRYQPTFKRGDNTFSVDNMLKTIESGYPAGKIFGVNIDLCPPDLRKVFVNPDPDTGKFIPYQLLIANPSEDELLDALASTGIKTSIKKKLDDGKSFLVSSARTGGSIINLLSTIEVAIERNEPVTIILNKPSDTEGLNFGSILRRIDQQALADADISLSIVSRAALDASVKNAHASKKQIVVISSYTSASRGLDLSMLDEIMATGGMTRGRDMIQFLNRLYHVDRQDATISMFNGGGDAVMGLSKEGKEALVDAVFGGGVLSLDANREPAQLSEEVSKSVGAFLWSEGNPSDAREKRENQQGLFSLIKEDPELMLTTTFSTKINQRAIKKLEAYNGFMSGTKIHGNDDKNPDEKNIITLSSGYAAKKGVGAPVQSQDERQEQRNSAGMKI